MPKPEALNALWYDNFWNAARCPATRRSSSISYSFGPGPITFAVKWIIIANVAMFVATTVVPRDLIDVFSA